MNLILFLLSFLFASYAPTATTTDDGNQSGTVKHSNHGKTKDGKNTGGEFIIGMDIMP